MDAERLESTKDISPQRPICGLSPAECQSLRQNFQRFRLYCLRTSHHLLMLLAVRIYRFMDPCIWEVWRALKKLELLEAQPRATLTHLHRALQTFLVHP